MGLKALQTFGVPEETQRCPACGAPVDAATAFCSDCDSLVSSATEPRPDAASRARHPAEPDPELTQQLAQQMPVQPASIVECWSCDTPNKPSRMFCVSCGSFIAIGSKTRPTPESEPFSGPPPVPGDADVDVSLPFVEGVSPIGSYAREAERRATRRTRTLTAVSSVVLAMVVGAAALYLASPLGERGDVPEVTVVATQVEAPEATERTGAVSGISIEPEIVAAPEVAGESKPVDQPESAAAPAAEPEAAVLAEPESGAEQDATPQAEPLTEPESGAELAVDVDPDTARRAELPAEPEVAVEPESAAVPEGAVGPGSNTDRPTQEPVVGPWARQPAQSNREAALPAQEIEGYAGGWVCNEEVVIEDSRVRDWSIGRVSFRIRDGFERVVLHLDRAGAGSGDPPTITADSMGSWRVEERVPGTGRPGLGRRSVTLQLDDGFSGSLGLRRYRPSGLAIIKEFSVYPAGRDGRNVVISADTDGCYRVRAAAWNDESGSVRRAEIHVDIKP